MPDQTGLLSEDDKQRVANWFADRTALIGKCPLCGTRQWTVLTHILQVPAGMAPLGGGRFEFVGICCSNCGNTHFIGADDIGIVDRDSKNPDPSPMYEPKK
nr:hypothetical protein [uncultured Devosia sp.]